MPAPSPSAHQVLVYSGPGVSPLSLSHTLLTLSLLLLPHYTVQPITPQTLSSQPWKSDCALIVFPGGRDLPYVEELTVKTKVTRRIKEYVEQGGRYLGICAGAYFGAEEVRFDTGGNNEVVGKRDLAFFPGACAGPTYPGFAYTAESGSRAVSLSIETGGSCRTLDHLYYNGGGHFILPSSSASVEVIARYANQPSSSGAREGPIAAVLTKNGKGKALLCSVHFEYPLIDPPARDAIAKLEAQATNEDVVRSERARIAWAEDLLKMLGLAPPGRRRDSSASAVVESDGDENAEQLLHPSHPSPIFVLSHPLLPLLGQSVLAAPALVERTDATGGNYILRDTNDELKLISVNAVAGSSRTKQDDVTGYLAERRRLSPVFEPSLARLSIQNEAPVPAQMPDFNAIPKTIILPSDELPYTPRWTPLFNFETYWSELDDARRRDGRKSGVLRKDPKGKDLAILGDQLLYAETVTSTQTMLDRNLLLLGSLPPPLAFLASFQLTGRGRGSNIWLSPPGCLQFSLLLTLPQSLSSKIVFIQYLMALAVCEALDDDGRLGMRIKWPNDLYAEVEGVGGTEVGGGKKGRAKLGGILVNTNLINGEWRVVVGCGINILNALPTTSLSQLYSLLTTHTTSSAKSTPRALPAAPTMEGCFARIMNSFDSKWEQFVEEKGFQGFQDEYYSRWLHSDQDVTLTTTDPPTRLRIKGITPDYGFLRCIPLPSGARPYSRGDYGDDDRTSFTRSFRPGTEEYVDLQPDGNSFDLMSGLIKRKV